MKITTLYGWPTDKPEGNPKVISCVAVDGKERLNQASMFYAAKQDHVFPPGFRFLAFSVDTDPTVAIHISDDTADLIAGYRRNQEKREADQKNAADAQNKKRLVIEAAHDALKDAAIKWNKAREMVFARQRVSDDADANFKQAGTDSFKSKLTSAKQGLDAAIKSADEAKAKYEAAKKAKEDLINPPKAETAK